MTSKLIEIIAKIISDRERAELQKQHAKNIMQRRPPSKTAMEPPEEKKRPPFLKSVKNAQEAKEFQKEVKQHKERGSLIVHIDIMDNGTVYSSDKSFLRIGANRDEIPGKVKEIEGKLRSHFGYFPKKLHWSAGGDPKEGFYTSETAVVPPDEIPWDIFPEKTRKLFMDAEDNPEIPEVQIMVVLELKFPHLTGTEMKGVA